MVYTSALFSDAHELIRSHSEDDVESMGMEDVSRGTGRDGGRMFAPPLPSILMCWRTYYLQLFSRGRSREGRHEAQGGIEVRGMSV